MEKDGPEEFQLLSAMGIVRGAFSILLRSSRRKLVWALALTLILPFSFANLGHRFFPGHDFSPKINQKQTEKTILAGETIWREWREVLVGVAESKTREVLVGVAESKTREVLVGVAAYNALGLALLVLSTAAVVYTVASIYPTNTKNSKVSYVRVLRADVPRVWKRLTLTFLWFSIISFGFMMLSMLANGLLFIIFVTTIGGEADHKSNSGASLLVFPLGVILVTVVAICLRTYISTVCYLASVVSVLEDKYYGLAAMRRSNQLIKRKLTTALALIILHDIFAGAIGELFVYSVVNGRSYGVGITTRAVYGVLLVGLLCFVNLMELLTQSVLYFVCKSCHHDSIYNNSILKVYKSVTMSL